MVLKLIKGKGGKKPMLCNRCGGSTKAEEPLSPATHCICPSGAIIRLLRAGPLAKSFPVKALEKWIKAGQPDCFPMLLDGVGWVAMDMAEWRDVISTAWQEHTSSNKHTTKS